ncbi:thymidylate kinase domain protein [Mycobacterium xenopi 3993]|nr:thymidylate kinase domain protein [Mycobacterium xenopi 3993]
MLQLPADPDDTDRFERVRAALLAARSTRPNRTATTRSSPPGTGLPLPHFRKPVWRWMIRVGRRGGAMRRGAGRAASGRRAAATGQPGRAGRRERGHSRRPCHAGDRAVDAPPVDRDPGWLATAIELLDIALAHFADPDQPGRWFDSADDAEQLMARPADPTDGATPSGASSITEALLTAAHLVGGDRAERYRQAAADALRAHSPLLAACRARPGIGWRSPSPRCGAAADRGGVPDVAVPVVGRRAPAGTRRAIVVGGKRTRRSC